MAVQGRSNTTLHLGIIIVVALAATLWSSSPVAIAGGTAGFVTTQGMQFSVDGRAFLFNGFNSYWLMHIAAEPIERHRVSEVLQSAAAAGLTVCRTWAFSDGGDRALQISPGIYDETVFQGLDFVISEAERNGIKLILSLSNNFDDFGGRKQYVEWARDAGAPVTCDDDFYTSPVVKGYYKNHVQTVLTRFNTMTKTVYKDDPTIMAWELINEPRCQVDYSGRTVNDWVQEMASYTKSIDGEHLLEVGMEGFYGDSTPERKQFNPGYQVGADFIASNLVGEIDFATIHAYPDIWLSGQTDGSQTEFVERWMRSHSEDATEKLKKPLVFAEFGKSSRDPGYTCAERDAYLSLVYGEISALAKDGTNGASSFAGGLVWQLMADGMEAYYDGYEIVLDRDASTAAVIVQQSRAMASLGHAVAVDGSRRRLLNGRPWLLV